MIQGSTERICIMYLREMDGEDRTYSSLFQSTHNIESSSLDTRKKITKHPTGILNSLLTLNHLQDGN